ncbi:hypothetical protein DENSPDRAFT_851620 [Dentipellis sp. KUC8613]|nr:hypothetical protein DENSPDRAFT_851620 [Dentipellis sp. KUC8613]
MFQTAIPTPGRLSSLVAGSTEPLSNALYELNVLQSASEDALLRSGNPAFRQLFYRCHELDKKFAEVSSENKALQMLVSAQAKGEMPTAPIIKGGGTQRSHIRLIPLEPLSSSDYPAVRFWTSQSWKLHVAATDASTAPGQRSGKKGSTRSSKGENVQLLFVENEHGITADGHRAKAIRNLAHDIFEDLYANGVRASSYCRKMPHHAKEYYRTEMATKFPELRLCDVNWKADAIAIIIYPGWWKSRNGQSAKEEPASDPDENISPAPGEPKAVEVAEVARGHKRLNSTHAVPDTGKKAKTAGTEAPGADPDDSGAMVRVVESGAADSSFALDAVPILASASPMASVPQPAISEESAKAPVVLPTKPKPMRLPKKPIAKNFCMHAWKKDNLQGERPEFDKYWSSLSEDEQKKYKDIEEDYKSRNIEKIESNYIETLQ